MPGHDESFTLPAVHAIHLAELVAAAGIAREELFVPLGLDPAVLAEPGARLAVPIVVRLFERARDLTRNPGIGIQLGLQMRASAHGYLGFAAMTASTLREALETATRFVPTRTNAVGLSLHVTDASASLVIEERADFGAARDAILFALAVGIWQIGEALTGTSLKGSADFAFSRPAYVDLLSGGLPTRFDQPLTQLVFDPAALAWPLTMSDPVSRKIACAELERSLEELGGDQEILARVRALVQRASGGFHSLEDIAGALHLSSRTLKRRLAGKGVTYSEILEEQRREKAILLLRSPSLSLDQVAEQLGYSDPSNFRRAFRRWTGISPAAYRRGAAISRGAEGARPSLPPEPETSGAPGRGAKAESRGAGSRRTPG